MLSRSVSVSALLAIISLAALVSMPTAPVRAQAKKESQKFSNEELAASIGKLHRIKHTLEAADHDYGGHRAAAVGAVKNAADELQQALEHAKSKGVKNTKDVGSSDPKQKMSNKDLEESIAALKKTHKALEESKQDYGGHRAKAVAELGTAITQVEKALTYINKKKGKK